MMGRSRKAETPKEPAPQAVETAPEAQATAVETATETQAAAVGTAPETQATTAETAPETQAKVVETSTETQATAVETATETPEEVQTGIDLKDTALADIFGELVVVHADGGLNLRVGPGRSYPVAELLEDGTLLVVLELPHGAEVPGWGLVHTGQRTGWVDVSFLQELKPEGKE